MAKKSEASAKSSTAPAKKAAAKPKAESKKAVPRGPLAKLKAVYESKESLVGNLVGTLRTADEDEAALKQRLLKASNAQLLRLATTVDKVKKQYGGRQQLIDAVSKAMNKAKDKDFMSKLASFPLPRLLDLASAAARRAK